MRRHIALISIALSGICHAQAGPASIDSLSHELDEVVVSATMASKSARSAAPLRSMDAQQMLRAGVTDVSDALHRMPGVTLKDYGGAGGLKTVSVRGFGSSHTGVAYDGVPVSDAQNGQIDLSRYTIDNISNVSMVIGDNDDIFIPARLASSAATVSLATIAPISAPELCARLRIGSYGYCNPFIRIGSPLGQKAYANLIGEYIHADNNYPFTLKNGTITTRERRQNSQMDSGHGELNVVLNPNSSHTLTAKAYYYNSHRHLPGPVVYYTNASQEELSEQNAMAQAQLRSCVNAWLSIKATAKFNFASSFYHDENGKYPGGVLDQNYWQREWYGSCAMLFQPSAHWLLDYSADYFYNSLNSNLPTDRRPYRHSVLQSATAKYVTKRFTAMARLLGSIYVNGAERGTAARNASKLSPSLCLSYQPIARELIMLRASYKNIFRMPTFTEAYFDHYGSADILPENTHQINIGATYTARASQLVPQAMLTVDAYANSISNMIVAVPYNMFVWSMVNLGRVRAYGIDATASLTIAPAKSHDISLSLSYSFQRAMPRTNPESNEWNKQVAYIPKHSGSASASYENPWVCASVYCTAVSDRYATNNNVPATRIDGYADFGAALWHTFAFGRHKLDLRADAQNIFDKQYCIVARYPMPGRQFKLTLTYNI